HTNQRHHQYSVQNVHHLISVSTLHSAQPLSRAGQPNRDQPETTRGVCPVAQSTGSVIAALVTVSDQCPTVVSPGFVDRDRRKYSGPMPGNKPETVESKGTVP